MPENLIKRKEEDPKEILGKNARPTMKHLVQQGMLKIVLGNYLILFITVQIIAKQTRLGKPQKKCKKLHTSCKICMFLRQIPWMDSLVRVLGVINDG